MVSHLSRFDNRQYGEPDIQAAIGHFKHAIENDSTYALAYAGLADAYLLLGHPAWGGHSPKETLSDAKAAARKALELDPSLAEAHFSLAQTLEYDWNWSEAEKEYRLALQLNPNYVDAHCQYGRLVQALGRNDEAMTQMNYAMALDPFGITTRVCVAYVTYASRQYDLAIERFERLGAVPWTDRATTELRASGETIQPGGVIATNELTPQELQVALTVAKGATNREAGAALFLSPKTIEAHLGRIYRKLDVRSRTELAALLAREEVLSAV